MAQVKMSTPFLTPFQQRAIPVAATSPQIKFKNHWNVKSINYRIGNYQVVVPSWIICLSMKGNLLIEKFQEQIKY